MPNGIKIEEDAPGAGRAAAKGDEVTVHCRFSLNRGEPVPGMDEVTVTFRIGRRSVIAGLENGVIGMMVGGRRRLRISPHLAYRDAGLPDRIPPNAVLVCDVELVEIAGDPPVAG